jgi:HEAT repeat protein
MSSNQSGKKISRIVHRKNLIRQHLVKRDIPALQNLARGGQNILRTLSSLIFDREPLIRWRAIEALGKVSRIIFGIDPNKVRRQIRRFLWLMNDESGGLCRNGPEAIGEIIYNNPDLLEEYGPILISFLNEEPFEAGTRNALSRIGGIAPEIFEDSIPVIIKSLESGDAYIRGFSIKALQAMNDKSARDKIETMTDDHHKLDDYDFETGEQLKVKVSELAISYLNQWRENSP